MRYRESVGTTPSQPAAIPIETGSEPTPHSEILHDLYTASDTATYGLTPTEFAAIFAEQADTLTNLNAQYRNDFLLAHACAHGHNGAWEHFLALYRQPLTRAAIAITGNQTEGHDLADALYAELYGLTTRVENGDGSATPTTLRKSPLASYKGRGSLLGWLRTTLAQRHVDHHRKTWREQPLDDPDNPIDPPTPPQPAPASPAELDLLNRAVQQSLAQRTAEERFLLAAYYLDRRTLLQIAQILRVHEATVSRKLHRLLEDLRKDLLRNLQSLGLSKRAAQEALGADPRDLDQLSGNLSKLLQISQSHPFQEKAGQ
jgi:RNA polymerase sigma-70 factor (ECF subfamily)